MEWFWIYNACFLFLIVHSKDHAVMAAPAGASHRRLSVTVTLTLWSEHSRVSVMSNEEWIQVHIAEAEYAIHAASEVAHSFLSPSFCIPVFSCFLALRLTALHFVTHADAKPPTEHAVGLYTPGATL